MTAAQAQIEMDAQGGSGYMSLRSYQGAAKESFFQVRIHIRQPIRIDNWSLVVRIIDPVRNTENKTMDPSKIKIRLGSVSLEAPSISEMGASTAPLSFGGVGVDVPLIQRSKTPLESSSYYKQMLFSFDLLLDGGSYLQELKSWSEYPLNVRFLLLDAQGRIIGESGRFGKLQIYPDGNPPIDPTVPTFGLEINANAKNGTLEFSTHQDYVQGVSRQYDRALKVTANTGYSVQVRSLGDHLKSGNNELPINVVNLQLLDNANPAMSGAIKLSAETKTVVSVPHPANGARFFDLRYFTEAGDSRLLRVKPANYQTTLVFSIIPQ